MRRSPGRLIRIVHIATGQILDLKVVDKHVGRPRVLIEIDYNGSEYSAQARLFEASEEYPSAIHLYREGEVFLRNSSGDETTIQVARISGKDVNIRLVDPNRLFEFRWSDQRLSA